jgi:hypothetical protein
VPCPVGRVYLKRSSSKVPVAVGYLADGTRRTSAGAQLNPPGVASGAVHCSFRRRPALYSFRPLRTGPAPRSLVIYGLLTNPGDVVVRCRSCGQPKRTRDVVKLKLLHDGDGRRQDPTPDTKLVCSDPNSDILCSVPEYRRLSWESGPCRLRVIAHDEISAVVLILTLLVKGDCNKMDSK